jgi:hypothetical protein
MEPPWTTRIPIIAHHVWLNMSANYTNVMKSIVRFVYFLNVANAKKYFGFFPEE